LFCLSHGRILSFYQVKINPHTNSISVGVKTSKQKREKLSYAGKPYFPLKGVSSGLCAFTSLFGMGRGGARLTQSPANESFSLFKLTSKNQNRRE